MAEDRLKPLDGLRAFAIISVMLCHSSLYFKPLDLRIGTIAFENLFYNGWSGVDLFFVLSGFLITGQLLIKPLTVENVKIFCVRRFFRIAPTYYVSLAFAVLYMMTIEFLNDPATVSNWFFPAVVYALFIQDYVPTSPRIDGIYWSIPIEIQFYLLCPLFVYIFTKIQKTSWKVFFVTSLPLIYLVNKYVLITQKYGNQSIPQGDYFWDVYTKFHFSLDGLLGGFICAILWHHKKTSEFLNRHYVSQTLIFFGFCIYLILSLPVKIKQPVVFPTEHIFTPALYAIAFCMILLGTLPGKGTVARFLSHPILKFIAVISYSLYLSHFISYGFQELFLLKLKSITGYHTLSWFLSLPFYFGLCFCIAYILHIMVEKPCIDWSKKNFSIQTALSNQEKT